MSEELLGGGPLSGVHLQALRQDGPRQRAQYGEAARRGDAQVRKDVAWGRSVVACATKSRKAEDHCSPESVGGSSLGISSSTRIGCSSA